MPELPPICNSSAILYIFLPCCKSSVCILKNIWKTEQILYKSLRAPSASQFTVKQFALSFLFLVWGPFPSLNLHQTRQIMSINQISRGLWRTDSPAPYLPPFLLWLRQTRRNGLALTCMAVCAPSSLKLDS